MSTWGWIILYTSVWAVSFALTSRIRQYALEKRWIDHPNERSSHTTPTPRGGGLSVVATFSVFTLLLGMLSVLELNVVVAMIGGGYLVAVVGYLDDRFHLSSLIRFGVHFVASVWVVTWLGGMPALSLLGQVVEWGWFGHVFGVVGLVWLINLYNFMDGIDGIAASEAVFISLVGGGFVIVAGSASLGGWILGLGVSALGFLYWNWPPARIFMGDVCSGFLGLMVGLMAIISANTGAVSLWVWLILIGVFFVDATLTLIRRMARGERFAQAHRTHAYQHLTQRLGRHLPVTRGVWLINLLWLAPLALAVQVWPHLDLLWVLLALIPLFGLALWLRAGLPALNRD